jgi:acetyl esterase/lipase
VSISGVWIMNFNEFSQKLRDIGREVSPATLVATRQLVLQMTSLDEARDVKIQRDVSYGSHERQRLDVFTPASGFDSSRPVLVFVHGGGFIAGDKHAEGSPFYSNIGIWAVRNGFNGVTITYRLAPQSRFPSGIEDLRAVMDWLQTQGVASGLDAGRVFLMGQSAGGAHVASYVAHSGLYAPKPSGVRGVILLSGIYNYAVMPPSPMEPAYLGEDRSVYPARSSLAGLVECDLPMLVTLAEFDPPQFEQQGLELLAALQTKRKHMPRFVHAIGQNHLSVALYLGLPGDLVGPQVKAFIDNHG